VVVDRFSKMAKFAPTRDTATAQQTARVFFDLVVRQFGLPKEIISDRDPKFTSLFWKGLWRKIKTEIKMSTAFRPQTDRKGEFSPKPVS
jgi:hypothetical protein